MLTCTGLALAAADPATPSSATAGAASEGVVGTDQGLVRGIVGDTTRTFRGIPYAAPPTGELRWRSPNVPPRGPAYGTPPSTPTAVRRASIPS
ncbi:carboxylesterase family protein, partial [Pseudonocardia sp.]|uniref:carboxylesterase family protein n=1 Tax=Pseudonocardia sp. TaxID=60912 RepID=UPI0031FC275E